MHNIVTREDAHSVLLGSGLVNPDSMEIEGFDLLKLCGLESSEGHLDALVDQLEFIRGVDYIMVRGRYWFRLRAANHVLLSSESDQGKQAREAAIQAVCKPRKQLIAEALVLADAEIQECVANSYMKSRPQSLTVLLGSLKLSQHAHKLLVNEGYIVQTHYYESSCGYALTDKGADTGYGVQISDKVVKWTSGVLELLPPIDQIIEQGKAIQC